MDDADIAYHLTCSSIQGTNLEMRVQTPGKLASAQPMPQDMMPARKNRPSCDLACRNYEMDLSTAM